MSNRRVAAIGYRNRLGLSILLTAPMPPSRGEDPVSIAPVPSDPPVSDPKSIGVLSAPKYLQSEAGRGIHKQREYRPEPPRITYSLRSGLR